MIVVLASCFLPILERDEGGNRCYGAEAFGLSCRFGAVFGDCTYTVHVWRIGFLALYGGRSGRGTGQDNDEFMIWFHSVRSGQPTLGSGVARPFVPLLLARFETVLLCMGAELPLADGGNTQSADCVALLTIIRKVLSRISACCHVA